MPMVPENTSNVGPSLLDAASKPSKGNMLMAAAIQSTGSKMKQPNPSKPHPATKKIKVVK